MIGRGTDVPDAPYKINLLGEYNIGGDAFEIERRASNERDLLRDGGASISNLVYGPTVPSRDPDLVEITEGTIVAEPLFVNRASGNFHLRSDSPARDRGSSVDLDRDYDGVRRPIGSGYDIGAYEYRVIGRSNHWSYLPMVVR